MSKVFKFKSLRSIMITAAVLLTQTGTSLLFADGLPGEYYVTQRWRDLLAGHSPAVNPAFIMQENYVSIRGALSPTLQASFLLGEIGVSIPIGLYQTVGVSALGVTTNEEFKVTEWDGSNIVETGETFQDKHALYMLSWAINPWNKLSLGINANLYKDANFGTPIIGVSFDAGLTYRFLQHPLLGEH